MKRKTKSQIKVDPNRVEIPASAVREYITDMLAELCVVAKQGEQKDLHILLKLTHQAARTAA